MNQEDKQLILGLADRLNKGNTELQKDPEVEVLIKNEIERKPNAVYQLTQAVLLQEHTLKNAQSQIQMLQQQVQALQMQQNQPKRGFLGNLFGGNQQQRQQMPPQNMNYQQNMGYQQQGMYQQPQPNYGYNGGSSFLRSAATTAVGVAGGMFLFEGVSSLFSGGSEAVTGAATDAMNQGGDFLTDPQALGDGFGDSSSGFMDQGMDQSDFGSGFGDFGDGGDFGGGDWF